jgi:hypothetical protein
MASLRATMRSLTNSPVPLSQSGRANLSAGDACRCDSKAVSHIALKFGHEFTYDNENGNLAIRRDVLAAFRRLAKDSVVWEREDGCWRKRKMDDKPTKQQD